LCQNGGLLVLVSIGETEKSLKGPNQASKVGGDDSHIVLGQEFPGDEENVRRCIVVMQQPVLLSQSLLTFSRSRRKTSKYYAELTVWLARRNSL
jgi:hypothetical protein